MAYTLGQAAKAAGRQKTTLLKAIESGRLSATRDAFNRWQIDPAELSRVYPPISVNSSPVNDTTRRDTQDNTSKALEIEREERKREREQMQETINDLRRRLDDEATERRKLTALLTHQPPAETPRPGFWRRLFGNP